MSLKKTFSLDLKLISSSNCLFLFPRRRTLTTSSSPFATPSKNFSVSLFGYCSAIFLFFYDAQRENKKRRGFSGVFSGKVRKRREKKRREREREEEKPKMEKEKKKVKRSKFFCPDRLINFGSKNPYIISQRFDDFLKRPFFSQRFFKDPFFSLLFLSLSSLCLSLSLSLFMSNPPPSLRDQYQRNHWKSQQDFSLQSSSSPSSCSSFSVGEREGQKRKSVVPSPSQRRNDSCSPIIAARRTHFAEPSSSSFSSSFSSSSSSFSPSLVQSKSPSFLQETSSHFLSPSPNSHKPSPSRLSPHLSPLSAFPPPSPSSTISPSYPQPSLSSSSSLSSSLPFQPPTPPLQPYSPTKREKEKEREKKWKERRLRGSIYNHCLFKKNTSDNEVHFFFFFFLLLSSFLSFPFFF